TPEGAATAATYFLNLFPYVFATGDLDAWQNMSDDNCEFCNNVASDVTDRHNAGDWVDPWEQVVTPLGYWVDDADPNRYVVRAQATSEAHTAHSQDGTLTEVEASDDVLLIQLFWSREDWTIEAIEAESGDDSE
ncbi:DUF6318 family protein, partial [Actinomyces succiniciruminis]